jgi:dsDNA-binding SOS-regulon protein
MSVDQLEELSFFLAKNRDDAVSLLRGGKIKSKAVQPAADKPAAGRKPAKGKKSSAAGASSAAGK